MNTFDELKAALPDNLYFDHYAVSPTKIGHELLIKDDDYTTHGVFYTLDQAINYCEQEGLLNKAA